jgi:anti-sigma B factor antagonist
MSRDGSGALDISFEQPSPGVVSIAVAGELDMANKDAFSDALATAQADGHAKLVIDLRKLSFMDSSGLRLLLDAWNESSMNDRELEIVVAKDGLVRRVLEISGCDAMLPVVDEPGAR